MQQYLTRYSDIVSIVGDIVNLRIPDDEKLRQQVRNRDLAMIEEGGRPVSLAQIIRLDRNLVSLQTFAGAKGVSNQASVRFLGEPMRATYSDNIFGRVFQRLGTSRRRRSRPVSRAPGGNQRSHGQSRYRESWPRA